MRRAAMPNGKGSLGTTGSRPYDPDGIFRKACAKAELDLDQAEGLLSGLVGGLHRCQVTGAPGTGRSGALVVFVRFYRPERIAPELGVVKIGPAAKLCKELENYKRLENEEELRSSTLVPILGSCPSPISEDT